MFLDYFDVLILKIIFKNKKNIILIYFKIKNILKNNSYYLVNFNFKKQRGGSNTDKHPLSSTSFTSLSNINQRQQNY